MNVVTSVVPDRPALIEPATWRDLNALRHLEKVCFPLDAWPLFDLIAVLSFPNILRLKAVVAGRLVGFVSVDIRRSKDLAWISTIGVLPDYQKKGVGGVLLQACEQGLEVSRVRLNVRASNRAAIRLYRGAGYEEMEVLIKYYQGGENAIVLEKRL